MKNLARGNTGDYACEVSGEAPKFKTSAGAGKMEVIDLPDERPIIKVCVSIQADNISNFQATRVPAAKLNNLTIPYL